MSEIRKLLVANRGEIAIRVFGRPTSWASARWRSTRTKTGSRCTGSRPTRPTRSARPGEPIRSYLNIPAIIELAQEKEVDAIHPGYGFLSENAEFARACEAAGIAFVGPRPELLDHARRQGRRAQDGRARRACPSSRAATSRSCPAPRRTRLAEALGYPVIVKASMGGGGRGMRVVESADALDAAHRPGPPRGRHGLRHPRRLPREVHPQGQAHRGPAPGRPARQPRPPLRARLLGPAAAPEDHRDRPGLQPRPRRSARRSATPPSRSAGTSATRTRARSSSWSTSTTGQFYFIEVNPRIQVEHTVTEIVTGDRPDQEPDPDRAGRRRSPTPRSTCPTRTPCSALGFAFQCRITTEDPANKFTPDYGRITHYRSPGGLGLRLDGGTAITGAIITPFYDSLLVKVSASGNRFIDAVRRMERALQEFRVRGVKTNVPFLLNVVTHPDFLAGRCTTRFIDETPELFRFPVRQDRATKLLTFAAEVTVNGFPGVTRPADYAAPPSPSPPAHDRAGPPARRLAPALQEARPRGVRRWVREQTPLLLTDTTFRDAHQSLLATRVRTRDMLRVADAYARLCPKIFSIEMWGGATFDTAMRFLKEDPWDRLAQLREKIPNILFQMLLRGSNAVGYTSYPDNVVRAFVKESAAAGIDLFRVFDSLNWVPNMEVALEAVREAGVLCEAAICYTGDILDPSRPKYDLAYYVELAKELEKRGANLIAIKDMAGLCKPFAAEQLIKALREEVGVPIHFHTHDIGGAQAASVLRGVRGRARHRRRRGRVDVGPDLAAEPQRDRRVAPVHPARDRASTRDALIEVSRYWEEVRSLYAPFETGLRAPSAEVYAYEMPGGQYTNLFQQAKALGLASRWPEVCKAYAEVNLLFGDIVKVTPTSKVVGDMALFLVANNLTPADTLDPERELAFPESVVELFEGRLGQPPGGFPPQLQERVLKGRPAIDRPARARTCRRPTSPPRARRPRPCSAARRPTATR